MAEPAGEPRAAAPAREDDRIRGPGRLIGDVPGGVLIAGCGYVGTELGLRLARSGHEVWGVRHDARGVPAPIQGIGADLTDPASLDAALAGVVGSALTRLVYAASPGASTPDAYRATYVDGLRNVLAAVERLEAPLERLVLVTSTAVWGDAGGAIVDEDTPVGPDDFRGEILLEAESAAFEWEARRSARVAAAPAADPRVLTLRFGGIYGPGRTRLVDRVRSGEARCPEGQTVWSNRIHRDDAAGMIAHLLSMPDPEPVYIGVDDEPAPICDVYRYVAALLGVAAPASEVGEGRTRSNKRCSNARIRRAGYCLEFPTYRDGYRAMIEASSGGRSA